MILYYMKREFYVYILSNPERTVLYTGMTNNITRRLIEHYINRGDPKTFTGRYYCYCLVYLESFPSPIEAIQAEKYIKGKNRKWKESLIKENNPDFRFLNKDVIGIWPPTTPQSS